MEVLGRGRELWMKKRYPQPLIINWTDVVTPNGYPSVCPATRRRFLPSPLLSTTPPTPERDGGAARPPHRRRRAPRRARPPPASPPPRLAPPLLGSSHSQSSWHPRRSAPPAPAAAAASSSPRPPARCLRCYGALRHPERVSVCMPALNSASIQYRLLCSSLRNYSVIKRRSFGTVVRDDVLAITNCGSWCCVRAEVEQRFCMCGSNSCCLCLIVSNSCRVMGICNQMAAF